jgi:hypothetical protein
MEIWGVIFLMVPPKDKFVVIFVTILAELALKGRPVFSGESRAFDIEMCFQCKKIVLFLKVYCNTVMLTLLHC